MDSLHLLNVHAPDYCESSGVSCKIWPYEENFVLLPVDVRVNWPTWEAKLCLKGFRPLQYGNQLSFNLSSDNK